MTDQQKIEFRKMLADFTYKIGHQASAGEILEGIERMEKLIDEIVSLELSRVIGKNSKLRIN